MTLARFWPWLAVVLASPGVALWVAHGAGWPLRPATGWGLAWALVGSPWLEEWVYRARVQAPVAAHLRATRAHWPTGRADGVAMAVALLCMVVVHAPAHGWAAWAWGLPALVLGALFRQTQRVWPCVALHAWFNATLWWASR